MTPVLTEFASAVFGFEREPHFVREAQALYPTISFREVPKLDALPAPDHFFSLALVDSVVGSVATEIQRVLGPGGLLVLCEERDTTHVAGYRLPFEDDCDRCLSFGNSLREKKFF